MRKAMLGALMVLAACTRPETREQATERRAEESAMAKTAIDSVNVRYERYMNGNMMDSVASLFHENGVMMPPMAPAITGRAAIQAYLTANPMPPGSALKFTAVDVSANGPMVVERGTYIFSMPAMDKMPAMSMTGKYLAHWHWSGSAWEQMASIWSDDAPMTAAPAGK